MALRSLVARLLAVATILSVLGACNTVEGFGKDLKRGGAALEDAAKSKK